MAWLVYIPILGRPSARVIHDVDQAGNPVLGEVERGKVLAQHRLNDVDVVLLSDRRGLATLVRRYPPPRPRGPTPHGDDPTPVSPAPVLPLPAGDVAQLEVA